MQEKQKQEALERQRAYEREAEERTAKNRLKRQRKKAGRGSSKGAGDKAATTSGTAPHEEGEGGPDKKRKLAPGGGAGAGFVFKKAEERDLSDGEDGQERDQLTVARGAEAEEAHAPRFGLAAPSTGEGETLNGAGQPEATAVEEARPAQEAGIVIQDDD